MKWPSRKAPVRFSICITTSWEGISSTIRFSCSGLCTEQQAQRFTLSRESIHQRLPVRLDGADRVADHPVETRARTIRRVQLPSFLVLLDHWRDSETALQLVAVS